MKNRKLIYIEWADATANSAWKTTQEAIHWAEQLNDCLVKECGWVIKETKNFLCLAGAWVPENDRTQEQFSNLRKIPKTWIRKRKILKI